MKLIANVDRFGGAAMVKFHYGDEGLFFTGAQPTISSLVTLTMPGLASERAGPMKAWLIAHHARRAKAATEKEHIELDDSLWRPTVLDDFLDAKNAATMIWHVARCFTAAEIAEFAGTHGPTLHADVLAALTLERKKRIKALTAASERASRVVPVIYGGSSRLTTEVEELKQEGDRATVAALKRDGFAAEAWIDQAAKLRTVVVKRELVIAIARQLVKTGADVAAALDRMVQRKLDQLHIPEMWEIVAHHVRFAPNVHGETIDITRASEVTVPWHWYAWTAHRVGPVKPGRPALMVPMKVGERAMYVAGQRKLKHAVKARGGKITRFGNTLVFKSKDPTSVHGALVEVDRIDTLAQIDPARAVELVGAPLPDADPIAGAFARAERDLRWRRILADLLIERLVGIDADVARRLARAEAAGNRRRAR